MRHMGLTIPVIIRTHDMASAKGLAEAGATHVLPTISPPDLDYPSTFFGFLVWHRRRSWTASSMSAPSSDPAGNGRIRTRPGQDRVPSTVTLRTPVQACQRKAPDSSFDQGKVAGPTGTPVEGAPEAAGYGQGWPHRIPASY